MISHDRWLYIFAICRHVTAAQYATSRAGPRGHAIKAVALAVRPRCRWFSLIWRQPTPCWRQFRQMRRRFTLTGTPAPRRRATGRNASRSRRPGGCRCCRATMSAMLRAPCRFGHKTLRARRRAPPLQRCRHARPARRGRDITARRAIFAFEP